MQTTTAQLWFSIVVSSTFLNWNLTLSPERNFFFWRPNFFSGPWIGIWHIRSHLGFTTTLFNRSEILPSETLIELAWGGAWARACLKLLGILTGQPDGEPTSQEVLQSCRSFDLGLQISLTGGAYTRNASDSAFPKVCSSGHESLSCSIKGVTWCS